MHAKYDQNSDYHPGDEVEQDVRAHLGVYKTLDDVAPRYRLANFEEEFDERCVWAEFFEEFGREWTTNTRKYVYGKVAREWTQFCDERDLHPALATPRLVEEYLARERETVSTLKSLHDLRFRPLYRFYKWMVYNVDYPHTYNPVLMAVLFDGAARDAYWTRVNNR